MGDESKPAPKGLTAAELDELERLEREATPGRWDIVIRSDHERGKHSVAYGTDKHGKGRILTDVCNFSPRGDVALSCALRNAAPALLAAARELIELRSVAEFNRQTIARSLVELVQERDALRAEAAALRERAERAEASAALLCDRAHTICDWADQHGCRLDLVIGVREAIYGAGGIGGAGKRA